MKVICINDNWNAAFPVQPHAKPSIGEKCTVLQSKNFDNKLYYKLLGYCPSFGYAAENFAPSSNIDETKFERNYQKETV